MKGFFLSILLSIYFYLGILVVYTYLPGSILFLIALTILCFLIFWINLKYDEIYDRIDIYSRTIAFDFRSSHSKIFNLFRFVRPFNPYIGALGTILLISLIFLAIPALIVYWAAYKSSADKALEVAVFLMSTGTGVSYLFFNKDQYPPVIEKIMFFSGILLGPAGVLRVLS